MENKTVVFALTSSVELANEIVGELGIPLGQCDVKHFSDGEIMVELGESVRGKTSTSFNPHVHLSPAISWRY